MRFSGQTECDYLRFYLINRKICMIVCLNLATLLTIMVALQRHFPSSLLFRQLSSVLHKSSQLI